MPTILHLSHTFPLDKESGITPFVYQTAREAANQGHDVHVLVPEHDDLEPGDFPEVAIHTFTYSSKRSIEYDAISDDESDISPVEAAKFVFGAFKAGRRLLKEEGIDIIHAHWALPAGVPAALLRRLYGTALVIHTHGRDVYNVPEAGYDIPSNMGARLMARFALRTADHVIANSTECLSYGKKLGVAEENSTVLPFGVDLEKFHPDNADASLRPCSEDEPFLLYVGRLVERKGVQDLIRAVKGVENVHLGIIGKGEYRPELEELAGDAANIDFLGFQEHSVMAQYMATADIVAVPSRTEPFGIVTIEALASGTPVIGADTGGIADIVKRDVGRLFPPGDVEALTNCIDQLASDESLRRQLGEQARTRAEEAYNWELFGERLDAVYRAI